MCILLFLCAFYVLDMMPQKYVSSPSACRLTRDRGEHIQCDRYSERSMKTKEAGMKGLWNVEDTDFTINRITSPA